VPLDPPPSALPPDHLRLEFTDRVHRRSGEKLFAPSLHLVAGGFRSRDRLFRLHLTALCGESQPQAGHLGVLMSFVVQLAPGVEHSW
jgi:hypothetical protein